MTALLALASIAAGMFLSWTGQTRRSGGARLRELNPPSPLPCAVQLRAAERAGLVVAAAMPLVPVCSAYLANATGYAARAVALAVLVSVWDLVWSEILYPAWRRYYVDVRVED